MTQRKGKKRKKKKKKKKNKKEEKKVRWKSGDKGKYELRLNLCIV